MTDDIKKIPAENQYLKQEKVYIDIVGPDGELKSRQTIIKKYKPSFFNKMKSLLRRLNK